MRYSVIYSLLFCSALTSCVDSPTGRSQLILVGDGQMSQMGAASFSEIKQQMPPVNDVKAVSYVTCISTALLKAAGENPAKWEVQIFNDKSPNAFALPGKKIGVHTGMFAVAKTPAQLAAVIGHEIGHVQAKHGAERVSLSMTSQMVQQVAAVGLQNNENSQAIMSALGVGSQLGVMLPYSRTHETEADHIGQMLMAKAGFDPQESIYLWQNMSAVGGGNPPEFLSTHPTGKTRIQKLTQAMPQASAAYHKAVGMGINPKCTAAK